MNQLPHVCRLGPHEAIIRNRCQIVTLPTKDRFCFVSESQNYWTPENYFGYYVPEWCPNAILSYTSSMYMTVTCGLNNDIHTTWSECYILMFVSQS